MSVVKNKAVVRRYFEDFHTRRNDDILPQIAAEDMQEPTRVATNRIRKAFPDYRLDVDEMVGEGDVVATVWTASGTHKGEWDSPIGPVPPTGKQIRWSGTTTLRLAEGKIVDVIGTNWDHLGILQQLDAIPIADSRSGA